MNAAEKMSDEFYDWLDQCPVQWFRRKVGDDSIDYSFVVPYEENGEEE